MTQSNKWNKKRPLSDPELTFQSKCLQPTETHWGIWRRTGWRGADRAAEDGGVGVGRELRKKREREGILQYLSCSGRDG